MSTNLNRKTIASEMVNSADARGMYFDKAELEKLKDYIQIAEGRIRVVKAISSNAAEIIKETMAKHSSFIHFFKIIHTVRQYAAYIRDLDCFLRYVCYAVLAGEPILVEGASTAVAEKYIALNFPIDTTVEFIRTMQEVTASIVGHEDSQLMTDSFDYLCDQLTESSKAAPYSIAVFAKSSEDEQSWEPKNCHEWLDQDKLSQQLQQDGVENISLRHLY